MSDANTGAGKYSHHISDDEVLAAQKLSSTGPQRLYTIAHGETNVFYFRIPLGGARSGRYASVEFHVSPFVCELARHPLYRVVGNYTPSHDDVRSDEVSQVAQLVYDTYIQATRLSLDNDL